MTEVFVLMEHTSDDETNVKAVYADRLTADNECDRLHTEHQEWHDPEWEVIRYEVIA